MQINTNTLLLVVAAVLALGVAYLMVFAPTWGGLNAAGAGAYGAGASCGGGSAGASSGAASGAAAGASGGSGAAGGCGCGGGGGGSCGIGAAGSNTGSGTAAGGASAGAATGAAQDVYVKALGGSNFGKYDVNELRVKAGVPVRLHFTAEPTAGCGRMLVIYGLNVRVTSTNGEEEIAEFTPTQAGTYDYSCGMRMFGPGKFIVE